MLTAVMCSGVYETFSYWLAENNIISIFNNKKHIAKQSYFFDNELLINCAEQQKGTAMGHITQPHSCCQPIHIQYTPSSWGKSDSFVPFRSFCLRLNYVGFNVYTFWKCKHTNFFHLPLLKFLYVYMSKRNTFNEFNIN